MNALSIIIPSKTLSNLEACVSAIRAAGETSRIIVIDDGIEWRDLPERIEFENRFDPIWFLPGFEPFIFARNVNLGIRASGKHDVVIINDDALLKSEKGFSLLQQAAEENQQYGCIGAVTNVTGQPLQQPGSKGLRAVPYIAFVCVLIPNRTINRIGMLDERYSIDYGMEDRDYCEAIIRAGLLVGVHDGCFVDHGSLKSTFRGDPRKPRSFAKNYELFKAKWGIRA